MQNNNIPHNSQANIYKRDYFNRSAIDIGVELWKENEILLAKLSSMNIIVYLK